MTLRGETEEWTRFPNRFHIGERITRESDSLFYLKQNLLGMTKKKKLELEIMAVQLWFKTFGPRNMSSESEQLHMSVVLNKLRDKLAKLK